MILERKLTCRSNLVEFTLLLGGDFFLVFKVLLATFCAADDCADGEAPFGLALDSSFS